MKLVLILLGLVISCNAVNASTIFVSPETQNASVGDNIVVNVSCTPTEAIKAFEFRIFFNQSVIQAVSVTEGNFFDGYETFFNDGIINNSDGTIINMYNLILGQGNVTRAGTFATINFSVISEGECVIDFINDGWTGVTNETRYLSLGQDTGTVVVETSEVFVNNDSVELQEEETIELPIELINKTVLLVVAIGFVGLFMNKIKNLS